MKICYLCSDRGITLAKYNGSASHVRGLVRSFVELGHDVSLILSRVEQADELGLPVREIAGSPVAGRLLETASGLCKDSATRRGNRATARALQHIWNNTGIEQALTEELTCRSPDLVYERHSPFSVAGAMTARRFGVPHLLEVNAPLAWEGARHRGQALNGAAGLLELMAFQSTDGIIAVSEELRQQLIQQGVDGHKIHAVPNGVDVERFAPGGETQRQGLEDKLVVGFVGSLKPWHGLEVLIQAFRRVADDRRFHLLVVGDGPAAKQVHDLQQEMPEQVTCTGAVHPHAVPPYLRAIDIAVAPYPELERFYFSPLKVLEYMAAGTAVVCSRIGQLTDLVRDGETGVLVSPGDADDLAAALRRLSQQRELRMALGARAAAEALRRHSWTHRAEQILAQATAQGHEQR